MTSHAQTKVTCSHHKAWREPSGTWGIYSQILALNDFTTSYQLSRDIAHTNRQAMFRRLVLALSALGLMWHPVRLFHLVFVRGELLTMMIDNQTASDPSYYVEIHLLYSSASQWKQVLGDSEFLRSFNYDIDIDPDRRDKLIVLKPQNLQNTFDMAVERRVNNAVLMAGPFRRVSGPKKESSMDGNMVISFEELEHIPSQK